jgi:hypothetical protein
VSRAWDIAYAMKFMGGKNIPFFRRYTIRKHLLLATRLCTFTIAIITTVSKAAQFQKAMLVQDAHIVAITVRIFSIYQFALLDTPFLCPVPIVSGYKLDPSTVYMYHTQGGRKKKSDVMTMTMQFVPVVGVSYTC